ncbi:MAG: tetratricopeptide repeat protein [Planctomycetota bacterium]
MLKFLTKLPVRVIAWLSDAIEISLRNIARLFRPVEADDFSNAKGLQGRAKSTFLRLLQLTAQLLSYPIAGLFFRGERRRTYFWSLPFLLMSMAVLFIGLIVAFNKERIYNRYLARVQNAYSKQNGNLGVRYSLRWINDQDFSNLDRKFLVSLVQMQAGEEKAAESMLGHLSPEDATGLGVAHFWRASKYASELEKSESDLQNRNDLLERFRWHLGKASGVNQNQVDALKAMELYWSGNQTEALDAYRSLWERNPYEGPGFASLLKKMGKEQDRTEVLQSSAQLLSNLLRSDPWNRNARSQLAGVYESLGQWAKAEVLLIEGFQISRDRQTALAYQSFLERRIRSALTEPKNAREISYSLVRITRTQWGNASTNELVCESLLGTNQDVEQLQNALNQWLVEGLDLPLVHQYLALCKVILGDSKAGDWHLQQAYRYDASLRKTAEELVDQMIASSAQEPEYHQRLSAWRDSN